MISFPQLRSVVKAHELRSCRSLFGVRDPRHQRCVQTQHRGRLPREGHLLSASDLQSIHEVHNLANWEAPCDVQ